MDKSFVINNLIISKEMSNTGIIFTVLALTIILFLGFKLFSNIFIEKERKLSYGIIKNIKANELYIYNIILLIMSIICCYIVSPPIIYNFKITNPKTNIIEQIKWYNYQELKYKHKKEIKEKAKNEKAKNIKDEEIKKLIEKIRK